MSAVPRWLTLLLAGCLWLAMPPAQAAQSQPAGSAVSAPAPARFMPSPADASAVAALSSAQYALAMLGGELSELERRIFCSQAITELTTLYQLHGCEWALEPLQAVYARPGCPDLHVGYSADGRLLLRLERLELQNPAFAQYAVYLCSLESHSALDLQAQSAGVVVFHLPDGLKITAQPITQAHPLWPKLKRLAGTFAPVGQVPAGTGQSFKQVFALQQELPSPQHPSGGILAVSLQWGEYSFDLPYYENEVHFDRPTAR